MHRMGKDGVEKVEVSVEKDEPLKLELASFVESSKKGQTPVVSGAQGAAALDLALDITNRITSSFNE